MAINRDPSVPQRDHRDDVPEEEGRDPGEESANDAKKHFVSQSQENEWVDTLWDCSRYEEKFDAAVNSLSWGEVSVGWRPTRPNATYITKVPEPVSKKDADRERDRDIAKHKSSQKLIAFERDLSWKHCVEPGTYRYIPKTLYAGIPRRQPFNKGPVKRPIDENLKEHIRKVKEHLEKVLVQQASPKSSQRPLGTVHHHQDYVASLIREANPTRQRHHPEAACSPRPGEVAAAASKDSPTQTKVPDVGLTYTVKQPSPPRKSPVAPRHQPPPPARPENKTPSDLITALGSKLNELIQQDQFRGRLRTTKNARHKAGEKLAANYEKFTVPAPVESPTLNPLIKVTPGQRQISDDNELIGAVAKMNRQAGAGLTSGNSSPTPTGRNPVATHQRAAAKDDCQNPGRERYDPVNGNFFASGVSGKAVSPTEVEVRLRDIASSVPGLLGTGPNKVRKRGTLFPSQRQAGRPVPAVSNRGDRRLAVSNKLGEPLHRGVVDREVAGAIASELLPGVSGHKIRFPLQQAYHIV